MQRDTHRQKPAIGIAMAGPAILQDGGGPVGRSVWDRPFRRPAQRLSMHMSDGALSPVTGQFAPEAVGHENHRNQFLGPRVAAWRL